MRKIIEYKSNDETAYYIPAKNNRKRQLYIGSTNFVYHNSVGLAFEIVGHKQKFWYWDGERIR